MSNAAKSWLNPQDKSSKRAMSSTSLFSVDCVSSKTWSKKYKNKSEVFCLSKYRSSPPRNAQSFLNCPRKNFSTCFAEAYTLNAMRLNPLTHVVHLPTTSPFPTHLSWRALQRAVIKQAATLLHHDKAQGNSLQRSMHKYHEYPCIERYWIWTFSLLFEGHLRLAPLEIRLESVASFKSWRRRSTSLCQSMRQNQKAAERSVRVN